MQKTRYGLAVIEGLLATTGKIDQNDRICIRETGLFGRGQLSDFRFAGLEVANRLNAIEIITGLRERRVMVLRFGFATACNGDTNEQKYRCKTSSIQATRK